MKKIFPSLVLLLAAAAAAVAQSPSAREAVASLPESQAVLVINARRITNDALPRVLSPAQLADMDKGIADIRKQVNVDLRAVEYAVAGVQFSPDTLAAGQTPEFGAVVRGGFSADTVLSFVRMTQAAQHRAETHGGKTLDVYKIALGGPKPAAAAGDPNTSPTPTPPLPPFKLPTEIAFVSFGADELMVGTPAYVRAAIDARGGTGARVRAELADLALRNAESLVSIAGQMPANLSKLLGVAGDATGGGAAVSAVMNAEMNRLMDSVREMQFSVNMGAADFNVQSILRTDKPEDARALSGLASMGLGAAEQEFQKAATAGKTAKAKADARKLVAVMKSIGNEVRDNEITFSVAAPHATVAELLRPTPPPVKPAPRRATPAAGRKTVKRRG
jgi:hypothetical protein